MDFWKPNENGVYDDKASGCVATSHECASVLATRRSSRGRMQPHAPSSCDRSARGGTHGDDMLYFPAIALNAHDPFIDRRLMFGFES